jgi:hypothetical protein
MASMSLQLGDKRQFGGKRRNYILDLKFLGFKLAGQIL